MITWKGCGSLKPIRGGGCGRPIDLHLLSHDRRINFQSLSCFLTRFRLSVSKSFLTSSVLRNSTFDQSKMPQRRKTVPKEVVTQPIRQGRIAKTQARDTIRIATNAQPHRYRSVTPPVSTPAATPRQVTPLELDSIDRLCNILQDGFEKMRMQIHQENTSTFDQLMEHLGGLGGTTVPASAPTPIISGTALTTPVISAPTIGIIPNSGMPSIPYVAPSSLNVLSRLVLGRSNRCRSNRKWSVRYQSSPKTAPRGRCS